MFSLTFEFKLDINKLTLSELNVIGTMKSKTTGTITVIHKIVDDK